MKKVYLVNISGSYQIVMPYSCGLLHAYCTTEPKILDNYSFQDYIFHAPAGVEKLAHGIQNPDVLGLSLLSWNVNRSLKLARIIKEKFPKCLVIVGGPEVPDKPEPFLKQHPYVDIAVHKEGEEAFRKILLENLQPLQNFENIGAISYIKNGVFKAIPRIEKFLNPVNTPSPYLLGLFEHCIDYVDSIGMPRLNIWETNRGCPFSCTFCDWGSFVNQKVRPVHEERLLAEIEYIGEKFDEIHIADANFGILSRDLMLAKQLRKVMLEKQRLKSIHVTYTKNLNSHAIEVAELLETLKPSRAGFTFGIQSFDENVLVNIKRQNIPNKNIEQLKKRLEDKGIPVNFEMILGLPGETEESFLSGINRALNIGLTDLRVYQVGLFPNSEMSDTKTIDEFQIETTDIAIVDGGFPDEHEYVKTVVCTKDISREKMVQLKKTVEVIDLIHYGRWTYYLSQYFIRNTGQRIVDFYTDLYSFFMNKKESIIYKVVSGEIIDQWNGGSWNSFKGPRSPFNIKWGHNFFRKGTFFWLCISEQRDLFYSEMLEFLKQYQFSSEEIEDLIKFQNEIIIEYEYDPRVGKVKIFKYDWFEYFRDGGSLKKVPCRIEFEDQFIGRARVPLKAKDPQSYFHVAGGYQFHFQKINSFEFDKFKVSYNYDAYENRFEFSKLNTIHEKSKC